MRGRAEMESYEEFCLRSLASLQEEGKLRNKMREPFLSLKAQSAIYFYGRAVLSPLVRKKKIFFFKFSSKHLIWTHMDNSFHDQLLVHHIIPTFLLGNLSQAAGQFF